MPCHHYYEAAREQTGGNFICPTAAGRMAGTEQAAAGNPIG
jgi:hypothetical protein